VKFVIYETVVFRAEPEPDDRAQSATGSTAGTTPHP
jgi:hypothetical protein